MNWTNEQIYTIILDFYNKYGRSPKYKEYGPSKSFGLPSASTIARRFGSLTEYYELHNFLPNRIIWDKEKVFTAVNKETQKFGRMLTQEEMDILSKESSMFPSSPTIYKYYTSLELLSLDLGFKPTKIYWSKERILHVLDEEVKKLGRMITKKEIGLLSANNILFPSERPIYKYFKSMEDLALALCISPTKIIYSKNMIREIILSKAEEYGRMLTSKDINDLSKNNIKFPSHTAIYVYYDTLEELADDIGYKATKVRWTYEKIKNAVMIETHKKGGMLTKTEIDELSKNSTLFPCQPTIYKFYKNFEELALACGEKYLPGNGFSVPVDDPIYGYFVSTIEHRVFHQLLKYVKPEEIERQKKYDDLFKTGTQHTADFYIEKYNLIIEATTHPSKNNEGIPGYSKTKEWKESLSDRVIFVYSTQDVDDLMEGLIA